MKTVAGALAFFMCVVGVPFANAQTRYITRPDVNGRPTRIPVAKTFDECVAISTGRLGHPRVGPRGEQDPRGAVGFCARLNLPR